MMKKRIVCFEYRLQVLTISLQSFFVVSENFCLGGGKSRQWFISKCGYYQQCILLFCKIKISKSNFQRQKNHLQTRLIASSYCSDIFCFAFLAQQKKWKCVIFVNTFLFGPWHLLLTNTNNLHLWKNSSRISSFSSPFAMIQK